MLTSSSHLRIRLSLMGYFICNFLSFFTTTESTKKGKVPTQSTSGKTISFQSSCASSFSYCVALTLMSRLYLFIFHVLVNKATEESTGQTDEEVKRKSAFKLRLVYYTLSSIAFALLLCFGIGVWCHKRSHRMGR